MQAGPGQGHQPQTASVIVIIYLRAAPVPARGNQFKGLAKQRMKGVGNAESSSFSV